MPHSFIAIALVNITSFKYTTQTQSKYVSVYSESRAAANKYIC